MLPREKRRTEDDGSHGHEEEGVDAVGVVARHRCGRPGGCAARRAEEGRGAEEATRRKREKRRERRGERKGDEKEQGTHTHAQSPVAVVDGAREGPSLPAEVCVCVCVCVCVWVKEDKRR